MVIRLSPGDVVKLHDHLEAVKTRSADGDEFWEAVEPYAKPKEGVGPNLFGANTGVYLGEIRYRMRDGRASRGSVRRLFQKFFFNDTEVMIPPERVAVFLSIKDIEDFDEESDS